MRHRLYRSRYLSNWFMRSSLQLNTMPPSQFLSQIKILNMQWFNVSRDFMSEQCIIKREINLTIADLISLGQVWCHQSWTLKVVNYLWWPMHQLRKRNSPHFSLVTPQQTKRCINKDGHRNLNTRNIIKNWQFFKDVISTVVSIAIDTIELICVLTVLPEAGATMALCNCIYNAVNGRLLDDICCIVLRRVHCPRRFNIWPSDRQAIEWRSTAVHIVGAYLHRARADECWGTNHFGLWREDDYRGVSIRHICVHGAAGGGHANWRRCCWHILCQVHTTF